MEDSQIILTGKTPVSLRSDTRANPVMLQQMFERTVDTTPDHIAVICEAKEYSYRNLDQYANRIAHYLHSRGVQARDRVGILLKRSIETYAAIIAVLKLGATYIPLDTSFPIDRISYIIDDADLKMLISTESIAAQNAVINCPQVLLDREKAVIAALPDSRPEIALLNHPEKKLCHHLHLRPACRPKGSNEHRSIVNFLNVVTDVLVSV
jgi:non-ribosomal peptide synthetase component F